MEKIIRHHIATCPYKLASRLGGYAKIISTTPECYCKRSEKCTRQCMYLQKFVSGIERIAKNDPERDEKIMELHASCCPYNLPGEKSKTIFCGDGEKTYCIQHKKCDKSCDFCTFFNFLEK